MAWTTLALLPFVGVLVSSTIADHDRDENWRRCAGSDPDASIAGCTALISAGRETTDNQATVLDNRGIAYLDKDDYDPALKLNPDLAGAYDGLGDAYAGDGDLSQALIQYSHAITLEPGVATW